MCGISGIIDLSNQAVSSEHLLKMTRAIAHRGPDDEGFILINNSSGNYLNFSGKESVRDIREKFPPISEGSNSIYGNIALSHKRFSIIDLTSSAHQPLFDREKSCCIIFNGEIYNFIELRDALKSKGVKFYTNSDTEVIVELYKLYGPACFEMLNGFWALALYDFKHNDLILSRDRLGKKPLYYSIVDSKLYFASEIKALLEIPQISSSKKVNESVIYNWLAFGLRDLDYSTFYEGINTFPAGSWAVVNKEFPGNIKRFWKVPQERMTERDISVEEASRKVRDTLEDSVRIRLRADVPLCVELSGGLDSSALVAVASLLSKEKVITYTVKFNQEEWNEEPFARSVAKHYNVDYRVIENPINNFWSQILPFSYLEEEPYHSPNLQTNQVLWSMMRMEGIKVSLNGAAGDEIFAGYENYFFNVQLENLKNLQLRNFYNNLNWKERDSKIKALLHPFLFFWKKYLNLPLPIKAHSNNAKEYINLPSSDVKYNFLTLTETLHSEITNTKIPYWLRSGDKGYMGIPLEVRAPFLDYRMVEIGTQLPSSYLIRDGWHKWILRKAIEDILPADVVWRKRKMGFPFPYGDFYKQSHELINLILEKTSNPYLDYSKKEQFKNNWYAISFILWYELFINDNITLFEDLKKKASAAFNSDNSKYKPNFINTYFSRS